MEGRLLNCDFYQINLLNSGNIAVDSWVIWSSTVANLACGLGTNSQFHYFLHFAFSLSKAHRQQIHGAQCDRQQRADWYHERLELG